MKKRIVLLITALVMILCISGCNNKPVEESASAGQEETVNNGDTAAVQGNQPEKAGDSTENTTHKQGGTVNADSSGNGNGSSGNGNGGGNGGGSDPTPTDPENGGGNEDEEPEEYPVYTDFTGFIKVVSFNVEGLRESKDSPQGVVDQIKAIDADIVGLQELDRNMARSNYVDQIEFLAKQCGYEYYGFDNAQEAKGLEYGVGILSKFPIKKHTTVFYDVVSPTDGDNYRVYGRYELDVGGKKLVFYNTHLTLGKLEYRGAEIKQLADAMVKDKYAIATGDFNTQARDFFFNGFLDENKLMVLNGGIDYIHVLNTLPSGDNPETPIDNIICTKGMKHYYNPDTLVGIMDVRSTVSDHNMIYTYIAFPD